MRAEHHYFAGSLSDSRPVHGLRSTGLYDAQARHRPCNDSFNTFYRDAAIDDAIPDHCIVRDVLGDLDQRHIPGRRRDIGDDVWGENAVFLYKAKPRRRDGDSRGRHRDLETTSEHDLRW